MSAQSYDLHGVRVLECAEDGPVLSSSQNAVDIIGEAHANGASLVVIPAGRLDPGFFRLRTGLAGEIVQKFVTYRVRLAIVGDFAALAGNSPTLGDFIAETNRGDAAWLLADVEEVAKRLAQREGRFPDDLGSG